MNRNTYRSNLSYGRYNDGRSQLATLVSKLSDATEMCLNFDRMTIRFNPTQPAIDEHEWFRNTLIHLISLMHAVALATLRVDFNMENLVVRAAPNLDICNLICITFQTQYLMHLSASVGVMYKCPPFIFLAL